MAPIINHSLSLFNDDPIIKKSNVSSPIASDDQQVNCERSAAVEYAKSQWENIIDRDHYRMDEDGIIILVEASTPIHPVTSPNVENQTAAAPIERFESERLSQFNDEATTPVAQQLVQISISELDNSSLFPFEQQSTSDIIAHVASDNHSLMQPFISHSSACPDSCYGQNEFDQITTADVASFSLMDHHETAVQSVELVNEIATPWPSTEQQQQTDSNIFTLSDDANYKENKQLSVTQSNRVMTKASSTENEKMAKSLVATAQECRANHFYTMACESIEQFEFLSTSCPALMDRPAWILRRSYINCLKAECLTLDVSHPQWHTRLYEAYLLVANVLSDKSAKRMHPYATYIQMACEFLIKANTSEEIDSADDEKQIETFMAELLDITFKITDFLARVKSPIEMLKEWNPPNWFADQRSPSRQQNVHFFDTFSWIMALCAFSSKYVEDQLIYKRLFRRLGLNSDATWNEVVRAFRKQTLALHEDKNTPEMSEEEKADRKRRYLLIDEAKNKLREKLVGNDDNGLMSSNEDDDGNKTNGTQSASGNNHNQSKPRFNLSPKIERGPIRPLPGKKKTYSHVKSRVYNVL